jgi:hypothetical protein
MRRRAIWAAGAAVLFLSLSACAALEETRQQGAHFASWEHMGYSLMRGTPQATTKQDVNAAQQQKWWGEVVRVEPIQ